MIELRDIHRSFRKRVVLQGLDLAIKAGEHWLLTGPSGGGKSCLLRIIAGLDRPDAGELILDGNPATTRRKILVPPPRRRLSMVFQDLGLWPNLSALNNVLLALAGEEGRRSAKRAAALAALEACGLTPHLKRKPATLSGGEQQRLALARALAGRPRILLLDEPFASLDLILKREIFTLIRDKCRAEGITVLTVSHQPGDAFGLEVDRVAVLESGRISESLSPGEMAAGQVRSATLSVWHEQHVKRERSTNPID